MIHIMWKHQLKNGYPFYLKHIADCQGESTSYIGKLRTNTIVFTQWLECIISDRKK